MKTKVLMILLLTFATSAKAFDAREISNGVSSPYHGIVLDENSSKAIYRQLITKEVNDEIIDSQMETIRTQEKNLELSDLGIKKLQEQNIKLEKQIKTSRQYDYLFYGLSFIAGAVVYREFGKK